MYESGVQSYFVISGSFGYALFCTHSAGCGNVFHNYVLTYQARRLLVLLCFCTWHHLQHLRLNHLGHYLLWTVFVITYMILDRIIRFCFPDSELSGINSFAHKHFWSYQHLLDGWQYGLVNYCCFFFLLMFGASQGPVLGLVLFFVHFHPFKFYIYIIYMHYRQLFSNPSEFFTCHLLSKTLISTRWSRRPYSSYCKHVQKA